jgi:hypothetical protein
MSPHSASVYGVLFSVLELAIHMKAKGCPKRHKDIYHLFALMSRKTTPNLREMELRRP